MQISTTGLDLAKNVFQVHGVDAAGRTVITKQLRRGQVLTFFGKLSPCLVGMEACATGHHWTQCRNPVFGPHHGSPAIVICWFDWSMPL